MAIKTTNGFFNWLKSKFYLKTEIDSKLADKASTDVASTSANGLMSSADKVKLDGVEEGANKIVVDSAMSESSVNPVQNKIVKAELDSLNSTKANIEHTHNNHSSKIQIPCEYGNIYKYQKNGWAIVWWSNINLTNIPTNEWFTLADVGWENQVDTGSFYGNFSTSDPTVPRFTITPAGLLRVYMFATCEYTAGHYGYIIYPTMD